MGHSQRNWMSQASEVAVLVICCLVILLPCTTGYILGKRTASGGDTVQESKTKQFGNGGLAACASHPRNCPLLRKRYMQTQSLPFGDVSDVEEDSRRELVPRVPESFRKSLLELLSSNEQTYDSGDKVEVW